MESNSEKIIARCFFSPIILVGVFFLLFTFGSTVGLLYQISISSVDLYEIIPRVFMAIVTFGFGLLFTYYLWLSLKMLWKIRRVRFADEGLTDKGIYHSWDACSSISYVKHGILEFISIVLTFDNDYTIQIPSWIKGYKEIKKRVQNVTACGDEQE